MLSRSNPRNALLLVVCGFLLGPANGATPPTLDTSQPGNTIVTLPVGDGDKPSAVAIALPATSLRLTSSKLVSKRDLEFRRADEQWRSFRLTFLMYKPDAGHRPAAVAVISSFHVGKKEHIWLQRISRGRSGAQAADIHIAALEHLYGLALAQNPHAEFCLNGYGHTCTAPASDYPHPRLLREIAEARERAIVSANATSIAVPWRNVTMTSQPKGASGDRVGVRVTDHGVPLEGATVFFNRAPHSGCHAKSSSDGIVTCDLVDQHGDEDSHEGQEHVPILATFPGDVQADRILLPTTLTWYLGP